MELNDYQTEVIDDLKNYLYWLNTNQVLDRAFVDHWKNKPSGISYETKPYKNTIAGVPHVCLKVPTGGGKTFLAVNAIKPMMDSLYELAPYRPAFVVWLVPSRTILEQTYQQLSDPQHPYHRKLAQHFNGRVQVYQKDDLLMASGFNADTVKQGISIVVMTFASLRAKNKDDLKVFKDNGNLYSFVLSNANNQEIANTDLTDFAPDSLINDLRGLNPILVVDESHNAEGELSVEMLGNLNPSLILDLTATPRNNSNIISFTDIGKMKAANMVKLPIMVKNFSQKNEVLEGAIGLRNAIELWASEEGENGAPYVRPIALIQAESKGKEDAQTFDAVKKQLLALDIPETWIAIKTANINELKGFDLMAKDCAIRYIITVNALKEGWDCPFAYVLATIADKSSVVDVTQILGRVLRKPYQYHFTRHNGLNTAYVLTASNKFQEVLGGIVTGLNQAGFSDHDYQVLPEPTPSVITPDIPTQSELQPSPVIPTPATQTDTSLNHLDDEENAESWTPPVFITPELSGYYAQGIQTLKQAEQALAAQKDPDLAALKEVDPSPVIPKGVAVTERKSVIRDIFKASAKSVVLPQFFWAASQSDYDDLFTEQEEKGLLFDAQNLLSGADLNSATVAINFRQVLGQIQVVDLEEVNSERKEYQVTMQRLSIERKKREDAMILNMTLPTQQKSILERLFKMIGKVYPFSEQQIYGYLKRITEQMDGEQITECLQHDHDYVVAIKNQLERFKADYAHKHFKDALDTDKVIVKPSWTFPSKLSPKQDGVAIRKSLYTISGGMNNFEIDVIGSIAALDNVVWWYRNDEKLKKNISFYLNGFINYYPDFIVHLKSGKTLLIESKGSFLDKDEIKRKIQLAQLWESLAGRQKFRHFMIFEHDSNIEGAHGLGHALELIKQL